jgi:hypothetical protein
MNQLSSVHFVHRTIKYDLREPPLYILFYCFGIAISKLVWAGLTKNNWIGLQVVVSPIEAIVPNLTTVSFTETVKCVRSRYRWRPGLQGFRSLLFCESEAVREASSPSPTRRRPRRWRRPGVGWAVRGGGDVTAVPGGGLLPVVAAAADRGYGLVSWWVCCR